MIVTSVLELYTLLEVFIPASKAQSKGGWIEEWRWWLVQDLGKLYEAAQLRVLLFGFMRSFVGLSYVFPGIIIVCNFVPDIEREGSIKNEVKARIAKAVPTFKCPNSI